jgi:hypothetical protein
VTRVADYAPSTPSIYHAAANATLPSGETGQSVPTIKVIPSVNVMGDWSGTLTMPGGTTGAAALDVNQTGTGSLTGTLTSQIMVCVSPVGNLAVTGYGYGTNISVSGSNDLSLISASIQPTVDPSGQQMNRTFGMF